MSGKVTMTDQELLTLFTNTLRDLLADDAIVLRMNTTRSEVPEWDSFSYINFIAATEVALKIKFSIADVESFENVGAIVRQAQKLMAKG
jgi:acyl carrier protein